MSNRIFEKAHQDVCLSHSEISQYDAVAVSAESTIFRNVLL